jgi:hypothetical protein
MELYIHFGIYKAGSSYLQYICANTRSHLQKHGYFYPYSKEDHKMIAGLISKGNADGLELALKNADSKRLCSILKNWLNEAKKNNCDKVLVSAEALVHQLAKLQQIGLLEQAAQVVGFQKIHAMGFFRDLADHALSTYKHRAKSGKIKDFEKWVSKDYETPDLLINLSSSIKKFPEIKWTFRKFQKDSRFLEDAFFIDWLNIETPIFDKRTLVNESLTLSEIRLMQLLLNTYPRVLDLFIDRFKAIPKRKKAKDLDLEVNFKNKAIMLLKPKMDSLNQINAFFTPSEILVLGSEKLENNLKSGVCC